MKRKFRIIVSVLSVVVVLCVSVSLISKTMRFNAAEKEQQETVPAIVSIESTTTPETLEQEYAQTTIKQSVTTTEITSTAVISTVSTSISQETTPQATSTQKSIVETIIEATKESVEETREKIVEDTTEKTTATSRTTQITKTETTTTTTTTTMQTTVTTTTTVTTAISTTLTTIVENMPNAILFPHLGYPTEIAILPAIQKNIDYNDIVLDDGTLFSTPTNRFFFGHMYYSFSSLRKIKTGQKITVWTDSVPKTYTVMLSAEGYMNDTQTDIIIDNCEMFPEGSSMLYSSTGYDTIRLITCTSVFNTKGRWLVIACDLDNPM